MRVQTYTQLFAAARILARGRIPQGDRLAIVSNGRGPGVARRRMRAAERRIALATFTADTARKLDALLNDDASARQPDRRRRRRPARPAWRRAVGLALDDPNVDAVVALHVPRPDIRARSQRRRRWRGVAHAHTKPVLAAWLGALDRQDVHAALEAGGVSNFYTPENAVDALSFLAAYRNNQAWLLEVPPPQPEPEPLDLASAEALRLRLADRATHRIDGQRRTRVLAAFGMGKFAIADSLEAAESAARDLRFPLALELDARDAPAVRRIARIRRTLPKAWNELRDAASSAPPTGWTGHIVMYESPRDELAHGVAIGVATDRRFGPVIWLGPARVSHGLAQIRSLMLPPLNARLAGDLIAHASSPVSVDRLPPATVEALVDTLTRISALVCASPWVRALVLDPVTVVNQRVCIGAARFEIDPGRKLLRGYPHMAIHPYPVELIGDVTLADGATLHVRPIRPEDAELEREFVHGLSEQTRYYRFFYRLNELTPSMLARFTQVDYDRELALVALAAQDDASAQAFVGVARYVANPDRITAEFAVVVADAWQRRGVARVLMRGLIVCAKRRGFERLVGTILSVNEPMLAFVRSLGFTVDVDPADPAQLCATLNLA